MRFGQRDVKEALETRWIWLKNQDNLTKKQKSKYQNPDQQTLVTAKTHQMRLTLQDIYDIPCRSLVKQKLLAWCRWVRCVAKKRVSYSFAGCCNAQR